MMPTRSKSTIKPQIIQLRKEVEPSSFSLTTGLRKAEMCNLKLEDLKTYRNQAVIDVIGKGQKFRRILLKTETLLAIKDYLKSTENGTDPDHPLFQTLGKNGPYQERGLTHKAVFRDFQK